jgi:hypothetical protein
MWTYDNKPEVFSQFTQFMPSAKIVEKQENPLHTVSPMPSPVQKQTETITSTPKQTNPEPLKKNKQCKTAKPTPMDIVIQLSDNNLVNADYIKQSLIDFISKKEFQKAFGVKRTSEIMQAISENKFNKSMALFVSFIFDVTFVYLNKDVSYYTENLQLKQKIVI